MADPSQPGERVDRALKTKTVYKWVDPQLGIEVKSKEEWKSGRKVAHFPFRPRTGRPKYRQIERIVYEDMPRTLPSGYLKAPRTGYGFARELYPVLNLLELTLPDLRRVVVSGSRDTQQINRREIVLSNSDLQTIRPRLGALQAGHRTELDTAVNNELARVLPTHFSTQTASYSSGQLSTFVTARSIRPSLLSEEDLGALSQLISRLPADHRFIKSERLLSTKGEDGIPCPTCL